MSRVAPDPFWDGQTGGGVRCSSTGEDASRYHDPSTQQFEGNGGRSIASLLPSGARGLRGVVIPRATPLGGSRGFDPNKPRLVNIDPDIKGQACVVDLSKITKESMDEAFAKAAENPLAQDDIHLLAAQTFHNLAVGFEPVGMGPSRGPRLNDRLPPLGGFGSYVVPRASLGGGQIQESPLQEIAPPEAPISPSITPRGNVTASKESIKRAQAVSAQRLMETKQVVIQEEPEVLMEESLPYAEEQEQEVQMQVPARPTFKDQSTQPLPKKAVTKQPIVQPPTTSLSVNAPGTNVVFETEGWGTFEAVYHEVIKSDQALILVYDKRFKGGMRFFPPTTDKLMAVKIDGASKVFFVHSCGTKFEHGGYEYCILPIEQESDME